ncbi:LamG domain-containing protein [Dactylosporangium matsuzakiense]|uniref:LamG domain-containing protein n=1 Tax=Dactylosporangium matsuzakiense TaxID=53360 RepID=UPI0021C2F005|nr:LamG domain-containing protein [Dactylosporangium matsuzakiense]UWZ48707.1 LamG domain-containing protein [Dactylosporangium matsuzakiense]
MNPALTRPLRRIATGSTVLVTLAAALAGPSAAHAEPPAATATAAVTATAAAPDARPLSAAQLAAADARAVTKARAEGRAVEVAERATETQTWLARPDGSMHFEESAVPTRVRRGDGTWGTPDPALRMADGRLRPVLSAADVAFSTGGSGPFATMLVGGQRLALTWPTVLRAPTISGDAATYAEALPGVDLVVRATEDGFSHVLVVKNRAAAQLSELQTIRLGLAGTDLTAGVSADGELRFTSRSGAVAASGSRALMWDAGAGATAKAPGDLTRKSVAASTLDGGALVLRPDLSLLGAADTQYPVYIDPSYSKGEKRWAYSNSKNENNDNEVRVGKSPSSGATYRAYFTFDVSGLAKKRIFAAQFHSTIVHSWSCANTPFSLYQVASAGSGKITWDGPDLGAKMGEYSGHAHKPSSTSSSGGCSDDPQPDKPFEIGGSMTSAVNTAAGNSASEVAFTLTAFSGATAGESIGERWKKFKLADTKITVDYNSPPATPTSASTDGRGCTTGAARPVLSTATPTLRAVVSDPDPETDLQAVFEWQQYNSGTGTWTALGSGQMNSLAKGGTGSVQIKSELVQGGIYQWRAKTVDPWTYGSTSGTDSSGPTGWCEFTVDLIGPALAPGVSSPVYGSDLNQVYGAVGRTAPFTFTASGVADVTAYRYGWADPPTTQVSVAAGASATLAVTPPPAPADPTSGGLSRLYVVSLDAAGHISPVTEYAFNLGSATAANGYWKLDDAAFADSAGSAPAAVPAGGPATGVAGRFQPGPGKAAPATVTFDGTDDTATVNAPVVDTSTSFTVSVWARSDGDTADYRSVVSAPATHSSSFLLGRASTNKWRFAMPQTDTVAPTHVNTFSTSAIQAGAWTNLTAVYDAGARMVYLYVNGVLEGSTAQPAAIAATRLQLAGDFWNDSPTFENKWKGGLADLRLWNRVLSPGEVAPLAADLVGRWTLDGDGADSTPWQRTATPTATAFYVEDRDSSAFSALQGDGATVAATTAGPALRSDQSYTVAAWVRLDSTTTYEEVLGQGGTARGAIFLRYDYVTKKWQFFVPTVDVGTPSYYSARSTADAAVGVWTHLVGVYDAAAGNFKIYVNGSLNGSIAGRMWASSGVFDIGRQRFGTGDFFTGAIDDVRVYQGAMPAAQVAALYAS